MGQDVTQAMIEREAERQIEAGPYERGPARTTQHKGCYQEGGQGSGVGRAVCWSTVNGVGARHISVRPELPPCSL